MILFTHTSSIIQERIFYYSRQCLIQLFHIKHENCLVMTDHTDYTVYNILEVNKYMFQQRNVFVIELEIQFIVFMTARTS